MQSTYFGDELLSKTYYERSENSKDTTIDELNTLFLSLYFVWKHIWGKRVRNNFRFSLLNKVADDAM